MMNSRGLRGDLRIVCPSAICLGVAGSPISAETHTKKEFEDSFGQKHAQYVSSLVQVRRILDGFQDGNPPLLQRNDPIIGCYDYLLLLEENIAKLLDSDYKSFGKKILKDNIEISYLELDSISTKIKQVYENYADALEKFGSSILKRFTYRSEDQNNAKLSEISALYAPMDWLSKVISLTEGLNKVKDVDIMVSLAYRLVSINKDKLLEEQESIASIARLRNSNDYPQSDLITDGTLNRSFRSLPGCTFSQSPNDSMIKTYHATLVKSAKSAQEAGRLSTLIIDYQSNYGMLVHVDMDILEPPAENITNKTYLRTPLLNILNSSKNIFRSNKRCIALYKDAIVIFKNKPTRKSYPNEIRIKHYLTIYLDVDKLSSKSPSNTGGLAVVDYTDNSCPGKSFYITYITSSNVCRTITLEARSNKNCKDLLDKINS